MANKRKTILDFKRMVASGEKIVYLTAYDYLTAKYEERAGIEMILVGDSLGMVQLGYPTTFPVTMDDMIRHCCAVRRGAPNVFIVGDMPYMSYQVSNEEAVANAGRFIKEADCDCIKLEVPACRSASAVKAIHGAGIMVMGHIGLTRNLPRSSAAIRRRGKSMEAALKLMEEAKRLEEAGCWAILVEEGSPRLSAKPSRNAPIFYPWNRRRSYTDGQLLIYADMVGYYDDFCPKFVKQYGQIGKERSPALRIRCGSQEWPVP
jgi:3-methyl-2-oxobutanoate hydroxymethyltransferase